MDRGDLARLNFKNFIASKNLVPKNIHTDGWTDSGTPQIYRIYCLKKLDPKVLCTDGFTKGIWHASIFNKRLPQKIWTQKWYARTDGPMGLGTPQIKKKLPPKIGPKKGTHGRMDR